eukprot:scaffold1012_cov189-Alexandrium_tamarense.AAC.23
MELLILLIRRLERALVARRWSRRQARTLSRRGNDAHRPHVPSRFSVVDDRGVLEFSTYDGMPLSSSYDPTLEMCQPKETCVPLSQSSSGNDEVCAYSWEHLLQHNPSPSEQAKIEETCGFVPVGVYYNDVWIYDTDCLRYADLACANDGWRILHAGMTFGGCNGEDGEYTCITPSERHGHGASMIDDTTLAIYGGYSHECEDYCDDLWFFDLVSLEWTKQEHSSGYPGKRWEFSMISNYSNDDASNNASIFVFGGHRLWHGFSSDNNVENRWQSRELLPEGGYLNDLWVFSNSTWSKVEGKETCVDAPGLTWQSRNDEHCQVYWPKARSGHSAVFDSERNGFWIHGGYATYYPYPTSKDSGSGFGVNTLLGREHTAIHPTYQFYLDDLWFYDIESGYWEKKRTFGSKPHRRTDHVISKSGNLLILHGGYADNYHFNDTWYYIIDENRWLEKVDFVHADYPETCIDDLRVIQDDPECIELEFPSDLRRSNESTLALKYQDILPNSEQEGYTPDPAHHLYFGIVDDAEKLVQELRRTYLEQEIYDKKGERIWLQSSVPDGTPIAPKAASGPRQYARKKNVRFNETTELDVWEWCTTAKGEPTRGWKNDGLFGRSNATVLIPQPRRQSPGWDGCEDFNWKYPPSRSDHASVYVEKYDILVTHGGIGYDPSNPTPSFESLETRVLGDMWVLSVHTCAHNCSGNGVCNDGFCKCDPGFYGIDCSNFTCPGSEHPKGFVMGLGHANALLHSLAKIVASWTASTIAASTDIVVWNFQPRGACARPGTQESTVNI